MNTKRILNAVLAALLVTWLALPAWAFSLRGPRDTWQTAGIGYGVLASDLGGPMNLGEEYRLNVPLLTYGFDSTFLNYFGSNGMVAVEAAFTILNATPHVSQMSASLAEFPTQTKLQNFRAASLGIQDIKSTVLGIMVAQMGLADPERFVWTLRDRQVGGNPSRTNYLVIKRNFDPTTLNPSSFVNGTLYTYDIREFDVPAVFADAVERPVDPQATSFSSVASVDGPVVGSSLFNAGLNAGEFFTGLTRDDFGGLRYLLRFNNYNVERLAPGVTLVPQPVNGVFGPSSSFGSFLFGPGGIQFSSPWGPTGTNGGFTNGSGTNVLVTTALRPGIGKVSFQKVLFDSLLYSTLNVTNMFTDTVITNGISTNQLVQRVQTLPDILFTAADLGVVVTAGVPVPILFTRTVLGNWVNNSALNGAGGVALPGPGVIDPGSGAAPAITITFSKLGPYFINSTPFFLNEGNSRAGNVWGYFDTTTIFSVFPDGTTVQDLENQVLGR